MAARPRREPPRARSALTSVDGRRHWIPPGGLLAGFLAHGAAWVLLFALARQRASAFDLPALAWVHAVALGWLTLTALSVLVHVVPTFTEAPWKGESLARGALVPYAAGVVVLVAAFWNRALWALPLGATLVALGVAAYLLAAAATLAPLCARSSTEAAIARALGVTLVSLLFTVGIGVTLAYSLAGTLPVAVVSLAPIHAALGIVGWLTLLVMGVSTRTLRPISGVRSRRPRTHLVAGAAEGAGVGVWVAGLASASAFVQWLGAACLGFGALAYAADVADVLHRATVRHRPPQAFVAAGTCWLIVGLASAACALGGSPAAGSVAVFVLLAGWLGQMVNGHLHHIGIRLIATMARGEDDETQPGELLTAPLSWTSFGFFQCAVAAGAAALALGNYRALQAAAIFGAIGWCAMLGNVVSARARALRPARPAAR